jgi:hypothetical protein
LPGTGSSFQHPPEILTPPLPPPPIRLDRIAARDSSTGVQGQLVSRSKTTPANVSILLLHTGQPRLQQRVRADDAGNFDVTLSPGTWLVYTRDAGGQEVYRGQIVVRQPQTSRVRVLVP